MYVCTREGILKSGPFNVESKLGFLLQGSRQTNISEIFSLNCALHQMREWLCRLCSRCYVGHTHFAILEVDSLCQKFLLLFYSYNKINHMYFGFCFRGRKWTDPVSKLTPVATIQQQTVSHYEQAKGHHGKKGNYSCSCFGDKMCL